MAQDELCVPKTSCLSISCLRAMSFDLHSTPTLSTSILISSTTPSLFGSGSTSIQPTTCADPLDLRGGGFPESDRRLSKRVFNQLKRVRLQKSRISSVYPTTSHCCLRLKILLKALLCLKKRTWTTNKFVLCWLHRGIFAGARSKCGTITNLSL